MVLTTKLSVSMLAGHLLLSCTWLGTISPSAAAPIKITFDGCIPGGSSNTNQSCCPPKYNGTIVDFWPKRDITQPLRVRKALQCLSGQERKVYKEKLNKAYTILRNLPDDDPRSLYQHLKLHCAYGSGALVQPGTNITIDIHFSWLFYPWHRYFVYFHERVLQHVLGDPAFSLHFWNWDNGQTLSKPHRGRSGCFKAGDKLPPIYNDSRTGQYEPRSVRTHIKGLPVDLTLNPEVRNDPPTVPAEIVLPRNVATVHSSLMVLGNTTRGFMGRPYRHGDYQVPDPVLAGGAFEVLVHASIHWWVGLKMALVDTSAGDPLFYAHHSNVDRIWNKWHHLPGGDRKDWDDPDFSEAEFLFWDETATLRRVRVKDSLDMEAFGYTYEEANDASWIYYNPGTTNSSDKPQEVLCLTQQEEGRHQQRGPG